MSEVRRILMCMTFCSFCLRVPKHFTYLSDRHDTILPDTTDYKCYGKIKREKFLAFALLLRLANDVKKNIIAIINDLYLLITLLKQ